MPPTEVAPDQQIVHFFGSCFDGYFCVGAGGVAGGEGVVVVAAGGVDVVVVVPDPP
jgi:hypothetical protein